MRNTFRKRTSILSIAMALIVSVFYVFSFNSITVYAKGSTIENLTAPVTELSNEEIRIEVRKNLVEFLGYDEDTKKSERSDRYTEDGQRKTATDLATYFGQVPNTKNKISVKAPELLTFDYNGGKYRNVEVTIHALTPDGQRNPNAKQILLGAHYDNIKSSSGDMVNEGVYDNAISVATLITLFHILKDSDFDFDIVFIFFGAEETGLNGSTHYASNNLDKQRALVYFNVDVIGVGDNFYIYTNEKKTIHEEHLLMRAGVNKIPLRSMPRNKKVMGKVPFAPDLAYSHIGMYSDHAPFANEGLIVATFFSFNLDTNVFVLRETKDKPNIMHTPNDNLKHIEENYQTENDLAYLQHPAYLIKLLTDTFSQEESGDSVFMSVLANSKLNQPDLRFYVVRTQAIIYMISLAVFLAGFYGIFRLLKMFSQNAEPALPTKRVRLSNMLPINIREQLEREINMTYTPLSNGKISVFGKEYE